MTNPKQSKKAPTSRRARYEKVKAMLLRQFSKRADNTRAMRNRRFRLASSTTTTCEHWFLVVDADDANVKFLIKGSVVALDGCIDGLNLYARQSPVVSMLQQLGEITKADADAFREMASATYVEANRETRMSQLKAEAKSLGVQIVIPD